MRDCTLATCPLDEATIDYQPTLVGNSIYLAFFAAILLTQTVQMVFYKTYGFYICILGGMALEILGYAGRIMLHNNPFDLNSFIIYLIGLTLGPAFLLAAIYICTGRIVIAYGRQHSRISPRSYSVLCISFDLMSLILQAIGGGMAATALKTNPANIPIGTHVLVAGLSFQLFSTLVFIALVGDFARRVYVNRTVAEPEQADIVRRPRWTGFVGALVVATLCILVRSAFRVDELEAGFSSAVANNQTLFMIFEGPFIIVASLALTIFHPGYVFRGQAKTVEKNDGQESS